MDAKKIWSYARRLLAIIPSIFICALGVALLVWPEWGCDPLTTFEIGLSNVFHVQFGTVALVFEGIMFFVFFFVRRDLVHLGTLAWCFLIGPFENFWLDVLAPMLPTAPEMSVGLKIACAQKLTSSSLALRKHLFAIVGLCVSYVKYCQDNLRKRMSAHGRGGGMWRF